MKPVSKSGKLATIQCVHALTALKSTLIASLSHSLTTHMRSQVNLTTFTMLATFVAFVVFRGLPATINKHCH